MSNISDPKRRPCTYGNILPQNCTVRINHFQTRFNFKNQYPVEINRPNLTLINSLFVNFPADLDAQTTETKSQ